MEINYINKKVACECKCEDCFDEEFNIEPSRTSKIIVVILLTSFLFTVTFSIIYSLINP